MTQQTNIIKDKIIKKYFKYNQFYYDIQSNLITKGMYFIDRKLIETQEKKNTL